MKRKEFIRKSVGAGVLPVVLNGMSIQAFAESPLNEFLNKTSNPDRVLVLVQLNGGNDGLNTVIPLDQYSLLTAARPNIAITESKVLKLTGTNATGLHPAMTHMRSMYDNGYVSIVQSVGYPNQDFSHFRSTDIWLSASDSNQYLDTGWMGRFLDTQYPGFPTGYPSTAHPDPPAIQIGAMISPALQGGAMSLGMSITDPTNFYNFISGTVDPAPNTPYGHELTFVRLVAQQTQQYSGSVKNAAGKATNKSTLYPAQGSNTLADQLKIVARLIAGGLQTKVYMVSIGGFDTHAAQVSATGGTDTGTHATLLGRVSQAVNAFQDDLKLLGIEDRVLGMTFSEFGRRIKSNDSLGTDHGAAAPLFVFGKKVIGGIYGTNPVIPVNPSGGDNIPMQFDFRSVYTTLLKNWFGVDSNEYKAVFPTPFSTVGFLSAATGIHDADAAGEFLLVYPNPCDEKAIVRFNSVNGSVGYSVYTLAGQQVKTGQRAINGSGLQEFDVETADLPTGIYLLEISQHNRRQTTRITIQR